MGSPPLTLSGSSDVLGSNWGVPRAERKKRRVYAWDDLRQATGRLPCPLTCPPPPPAPELDPNEAAASDPATGGLKYGWSNICLHYFRRDWLEAVSGQLAELGRYHIARKKIPSKDGPLEVGVGPWAG